jgi:hypothetical protein
MGTLYGSFTGGLLYDYTDSFVWLFLYIGLYYFLAVIWDEFAFPRYGVASWFKRPQLNE